MVDTGALEEEPELHKCVCSLEALAGANAGSREGALVEALGHVAGNAEAVWLEGLQHL